MHHTGNETDQVEGRLSSVFRWCWAARPRKDVHAIPVLIVVGRYANTGDRHCEWLGRDDPHVPGEQNEESRKIGCLSQRDCILVSWRAGGPEMVFSGN